ncbi:MAG: thiamine pyrophosphate-dependent dehydrogenase E1 component subunit alpha [Planctomycetes bacterium]|nr:thiamine pyrophosphate-dependent dehydrogenase E1 component subunit alpha [Planctomycetota bacterium]
MDDSKILIGKANPSSHTSAAAVKDPLPLALRVPAAPYRPGDLPRFNPFHQQPGDFSRPDTLAPHTELRDHAAGLIRVLGDDGLAAGPWQPSIGPQQLRSGLEMMMRARHFDARMIAMQRQGRLSFHVSCKGEEVAAVAGAMAFASHDVLFPSYRQAGLMLVRGMPMVAMIGQLIGNRCDNAKGRQMPVHYSWRAGNVVSISSPVGTQFPQAVGAAMAFAYRGERRVVGAWIGDGTAAQGDFHHALNFASVFRPPCVLHVVDNQWAISTHRNTSTGGATFAARADAYHLPGLRVDGNDFLAVFAAEAWAIERARRGGGPTLIELLTYRRDAHSTSDDPTQYRAPEEANHWPGGDPIDRLSRYLIRNGHWTENAHRDLNEALDQEAAAAFQHAESFGTAATGLGHPTESLFEDVYTTMPPQLTEQMRELQTESSPPSAETSIIPFEAQNKRAVG